MRYIVVLLSDTHANSKLALCAPDIELTDGDSHGLSKGQRWLWQHFTDLAAKVQMLRQPDDVVICIHHGDAVDYPWKHATTQYITRNIDDIVQIAYESHWPLREVCDHWFQVGGTEAHTGVSGEVEAIFAREYDAEPCQETGKQLWWQVILNLDGFRIDAAHVGKLGGKYDTKLNQLGNMAYGAINTALVEGRPIPQLVTRGHIHAYTDSHQMLPVRVLTIPGWQLRTVYTYRNPDRLADIGAAIAIIEDGELVYLEPELAKPQRTAEWDASQLPSRRS